MRTRHQLPLTTEKALIWLCVAIVILVGRNDAIAQCTFEWRAGEGLPGLYNVGPFHGSAAATTTWDPDGPGPQSELLVVGGTFTIAGNVPANYIATWNGKTWQSLGGGTNSTVLALVVYNGEVIAGGNFTSAGGVPANGIARWNGSLWQPLASGMGFPGEVNALAVHQGYLVA